MLTFWEHNVIVIAVFSSLSCVLYITVKDNIYENFIIIASGVVVIVIVTVIISVINITVIIFFNTIIVTVL